MQTLTYVLPNEEVSKKIVVLTDSDHALSQAISQIGNKYLYSSPTQFYQKK
jgi:hypothetical protein